MTVMDEQNFSREVAFNQSVINIGSDSGNDIVLMGDTIADFHAMLYFDSDRWFISSLHDNYKTTVNGLVVDGSGIPLQNGSVVNIGDYRLTMMLNGMNTDIIIAGSAASYQPSGNEGSDGGNILLSITSAPSTEVEVGTTVEYELTVTNAGPLVANMQLQLQGVPSSWVQIIPPVLNLNEGRKGVFTVRISPPRESSAKAGFYNLHFVAMSPNYQRETGIVDTGLTILPYSDFLLNGPTPRRLTLSRRTQTDSSDVVILNNSNSDSQFFLRSYDDANDLYFSYGRDGQEVQGQDTVTVSAGDNVRVPMRIGSRKLPLLGFTNKTYHYYTNVTPTDRPGDGQSVLGEVVVRPLINTFWLLFALALLLFFALFLLQPRILQFEGADGKQTQVILSGNTAQIQWRVSNLTFIAGKLTLDDGSGEKTVSQTGSQLVSPTKSTTYTLTAENLFSRLLGIPHVRSVQVLIIPQRPVINAFAADHKSALAEQQVKLDWAVGDNATSASILRNKQQMDLTPETYSGTVTQGYTSDTLFSVRALNDSGYEMKSLFLNVSPARINLNRFTVWVRPNGIAVPNNNDSRRTTRWSALQLNTDSTGPALIRPAVNPQPAPQSITLNIPDNFNNTGSSPQGMNPEQMMLSGQSDGVSGYVYQDPMTGPGSSDLLVSPSLLPTATPTAIPSTELITRQVISSTAVPATSPEAAPYNRDFSVKLVEVVEDPLAESGYRLIDYFPDYQLQKNEQILVEWNVDGVSQVKIENLSNDALNNTGGNFAYPEKSTTYVLEAQTGDLKKDYSLPVRVAGDADEGEGSGLKCDLKANAATLKVPGAVMLSWTGGGTNRVQLVSSSQAEKDNEEAQKKAEQEAKEKGQPYTKPTNAPLTGGTIGDWLQPSGFMRVNVEKQTTFVLNAYDGNGNVICTKSVDVKLEGGNDKKDISDVPGAKFAITRIADDNDVSQAYYTVGQTVHYTIAMTGFPKGQEPTGSVMITDGTSTCSVTLPVTTCAFQAKKAGNLTVTAVYSGDNVYSKATATAKETVIDKLPTTLEIQSAYKSAASLAELVSELKFDTKNAYGLIPTGTITFTVGSGTCDLDIISEKLSCDGKVTTPDDNGYKFTLSKMLLADANADRVTAAYKGDDYFLPSTAKPVLFLKIPTTTQITDSDLPSQSHADIDTLLSWTTTPPDGLIPTGTITLTVIRPDPNHKETKCVLTLGKEPTLSCDGSVTQPVNPSPQSLKYAIEEMLFEDPASDRVKAEYSGDFLFNKSESKVVLFGSIIEVDVPTELSISNAKINSGAVDMEFSFTWDETLAKGQKPTGALTITSGSGTCSVNINSTTPKLDGCKGTVSLSGNTFTITGLVISPIGDSIKVSYPGEGHFLKSESETVVFDRYNTKTEITKAYRFDSRLATIETELTWNVTEAGDDNVPSKTMTYKIGNESCVLTFSSDSTDKTKVNIDSFSCEGEDTRIKTDGTNTSNGKIVLRIENMLLSDGNNANSVKATYSGDSMSFNGSASKEVMFKTLDTELIIKSATKSPANLVNMEMDLGWFEAAPDNRTPTGIINLTTGSKVCTLDVTGTARLTNCGGTVTCSVADKKYICSIKEMAVTGQSGTNIKAEYAGDSLFLKSSSDTVDFSRLNTTLKINKAYKPDSGLLANVLADLMWDTALSAGKNPTGKLTFTIGSDSCVYSIDDKKFTSCNGVDTKENAIYTGVPGKYIGTFEKILLSANTADRVKVEYSGDSVFNPSSSETVLFAKVNTTLMISDAGKTDLTHADINSVLSWKEDPNWIALGCNEASAKCPTPTGTVKFTIRYGAEGAGDVVTGTCTLDLAAKTMNCEGTPFVEPGTDQDVLISLEGMLLADPKADRVKAEYSGDSLFNPSESTVFLFDGTDKIDTQIKISDGSKTDNTISLTTKLTPEDKKTGTITFTSGAATCTLNINDPDALTFEKCSGDASYDPDDPTKTKIIIYDMVMNGTPGDSIYAEYSGDANYNKSTSEAYNFDAVVKEDTTISIESGSKTDTAITLTAKLTPEGSESGTIVFTSGSATCTINIDNHADVKFEKCSGTAKYNSDGTIVITGMVMNGTPGDSIYAEYSGDVNYNKSTSPAWNFVKKTDTTINIDTGSKTDTSVTLTATLSPAGTETGTIVFTSGSATCTINIDKHTDIKFEKCSGTASFDPDDPTKIIITDMVMSAAPGETIYAEYSGDDNYNKSTSPSYSFFKVDTKTRVEKAYKSDPIRANFDSYLEWDPSEAGTSLPSGTITYTIGSDSCKLTLDPIGDGDESPKKQKNFTCADETTEVNLYQDTSTGEYKLKFTDVLLTAGNTADRIKAEYSGVTLFNPSSSDYVLFDTVPTTTDLSEPKKTPEGLVNALVNLSWTKDPLAQDTPKGTIKLTSGSATCTLNLAVDPARFTDCGNNQPVVTKDVSERYWSIQITKLNMGSGAGEDIIAEYSGSGSYLPSSSIKKSFTRVNTTLEIESAFKPNDPNYANLISVLSWNKENAATRVPTGTIKFTAGSGSCELNLSTKKLSCRSATDPTIQSIEIGTDKLGYRTTIVKMLLADSSADRVTVEYSGDAVFNPSSAAAMLFKKVDTTIDIYKAYRDKTTGRASVYTWMYWDEDEDEGLKPTGTLKYTLGSGSCTMDISTRKVSCVGDLYGMISNDGHDYVVTNLLLTDTDAKIISVEYSGDGFFNPSVSQQTLISDLSTTVVVSSASKGCDGENHCFINLSGTLDWDVDESVTSLPSGTLTIKLGEKSIKFNLDDGTLSGVEGSENEYANKVVTYDVNDRHAFEFKNLLLDGVADITEIEVEYSGDENYAYSSNTKKIDPIKIGTIITLGSPQFDLDYSSNASVWTFAGTLRPFVENLPIDFLPSGSFTMRGVFKTGNLTFNFTPDPITPNGSYENPDYKIEINWKDKSKGEFELKINYFNGYFSSNDLEMTSIVYNGDSEGKASQLYNASNTANYYQKADRILDLAIDKFYVDPSGKKNIRFIYRTNSGTNYDGKYTLVMDSGSCTLIRNGIFESGTCQCEVKGDYGSLEIWDLDLGNTADTNLKIIFEGNEYYKPSQATKEIDKVNTVLTINSEKTEIKNNLLNVYVNLNLNPEHPILYYKTLSQPSGELVVQAGDDYTCTMDLEEKRIYVNNRYFEVKPHEDCGSDDVESYFQDANFYFESKTKSLHIVNMPVPDSNVSNVKVIYRGDTIYNSSENTIDFSDKIETKLTLERASDNLNHINTSIRSNSTVGTPTGTVIYYFYPSGTTCTLTVTDSDVTVGDCPGGTVMDDPTLEPGNVSFILDKSNISGIDEDNDVYAYYSGDSQYASSEGSASLKKYDLRLTPDTEVLDSGEGRYYFNTKEEGVSYPKFPEQHITNAYQHCADNPTDTACRLLKHKFTLSVRIDTDPYAPDLSGSELQLLGEFSSDSSSNQCTITPDSSRGVYHCNLDNVYFTTPGLKIISASFTESDSFHSAKADFPEMYAVSISSDSKESSTAINSPASSVVINVGETVEIKAEAFEYLNSDNKDTVETHYMIYAYDSVTNHRYDQSCNSNTCTLTIPSGANFVIAEYLGNNELRPSLASKSVGDSSTSSGNMTSSTNSMPRGLGVSITIENIQPKTEGE